MPPWFCPTIPYAWNTFPFCQPGLFNHLEFIKYLLCAGSLLGTKDKITKSDIPFPLGQLKLLKAMKEKLERN